MWKSCRKKKKKENWLICDAWENEKRCWKHILMWIHYKCNFYGKKLYVELPINIRLFKSLCMFCILSTKSMDNCHCTSVKLFINHSVYQRIQSNWISLYVLRKFSFPNLIPCRKWCLFLNDETFRYNHVVFVQRQSIMISFRRAFHKFSCNLKSNSKCFVKFSNVRKLWEN